MATGALDPLEWLAAIPGIVAVLGGAVGLGMMHQRIRGVEENVKDISTLRENLGRIDERTKSSGEKLDAVDRKMDTVIGNMLNDARTLLPRQRRASGT